MNSKLIKKIRNLKNRKANKAAEKLRQKYIEYYEHLPIDDSAIFLEARNGKEIDGNIFYMAGVLMTSSKYSGYRLFVSAEDDEKKEIIGKKLSRFEDSEGASKLTIVIVESEDYYKAAATAKFIICDSTLKNFFMKKEGQIYLNVWHGTPFKVMGRKVIHEPHATGNAQKNFVIADYLLYPNEYMMKHMVEDYMIANASSAKILLGGYPRNSAFFDSRRCSQIVYDQGLGGKHIYAYMPTHRPELMGKNLERVLREMDSNLLEDEIIYAKIHPLAAEKIDFSSFRKIREFPPEYETYEFLNVAECLITDYSSVFYDFAVTGRKIVLFTYDEEEYLSNRGLYEPMDSLPFTKVKTVKETMEAARKPKDYDDSEFIERFCSMESESAADCLCSRVILGEKTELLREIEMPANGKKNIFVHAGNLAPGKRTDEAMRRLEEADRTEANYYLVFRRAQVADHKDILLNLPEGVMYFGIAGKDYVTGNPEKDNEYARIRCFGNMRVDSEMTI